MSDINRGWRWNAMADATGFIDNEKVSAERAGIDLRRGHDKQTGASMVGDSQGSFQSEMMMAGSVTVKTTSPERVSGHGARAPKRNRPSGISESFGWARERGYRRHSGFLASPCSVRNWSWLAPPESSAEARRSPLKRPEPYPWTVLAAALTPWQPGSEGKGLVSPMGGVILWQTDLSGGPDHNDVQARLGYDKPGYEPRGYVYLKPTGNFEAYDPSGNLDEHLIDHVAQAHPALAEPWLADPEPEPDLSDEALWDSENWRKAALTPSHACPNCQQPLLANGRAGFTGVNADGTYSERGWECPNCHIDFRPIETRPIQTGGLYYSNHQSPGGFKPSPGGFKPQKPSPLPPSHHQLRRDTYQSQSPHTHDTLTTHQSTTPRQVICDTDTDYLRPIWRESSEQFKSGQGELNTYSSRHSPSPSQAPEGQALPLASHQSPPQSGHSYVQAECKARRIVSDSHISVTSCHSNSSDTSPSVSGKCHIPSEVTVRAPLVGHKRGAPLKSRWFWEKSIRTGSRVIGSPYDRFNSNLYSMQEDKAPRPLQAVREVQGTAAWSILSTQTRERNSSWPLDGGDEGSDGLPRLRSLVSGQSEQPSMGPSTGRSENWKHLRHGIRRIGGRGHEGDQEVRPGLSQMPCSAWIGSWPNQTNQGHSNLRSLSTDIPQMAQSHQGSQTVLFSRVLPDGSSHLRSHKTSGPRKDPPNYRKGKHASGGEDPEYFYHMAPTTERARIRQHGLQPANPALNKRWQWANGEWLKGQPTGVYLTDRPSPDMWSGGDLQGYDMWRVPRDQVKEFAPDGMPYPSDLENPERDEMINAVVAPHVVYPELEQGGPETHGEWPKRGKTAKVPVRYHGSIDPLNEMGNLKGYPGRWPTLYDGQTVHIGPEGSVHLDLRDELGMAEGWNSVRLPPESGMTEGWIGHNDDKDNRDYEAEYGGDRYTPGTRVGWYNEGHVPHPDVEMSAYNYWNAFLKRPDISPDTPGGYGHGPKLTNWPFTEFLDYGYHPGRLSAQIREWPQSENPGAWYGRRPVIYDPGHDTLHIGPEGYSHPQVMQSVLNSPGEYWNLPTEIPNNISMGWVGKNPEADHNDFVFNRRTPREFGWYGITPRPPAATHQTLQNWWTQSQGNPSMAGRMAQMSPQRRLGISTPMGFGPMYHVAPRRHREQILQEGLQGQNRDVSPHNYTWPQPPGNYMFDNPEDAREYTFNLKHRQDRQSLETAEEDRWQWPEPPNNFHTWPDEQQDQWHDDNPPTPATEDPHGFDVWKVHNQGMPMAADPESQLTGFGERGEELWDLGMIHDVQTGERTDPWGNPQELTDWGSESRRYFTPIGIPPKRLQLHDHIPTWDLNDEAEEESYNDENYFPTPWAQVPMTARPWPGHESRHK